ncbi:unnamed protein product [Didymodactylos carnosus]|uniref:Uncharacterized protein n=1 Tax=Didymodactylos carnosus TaxID=1234261 RepID=A0A8S2PZ16_9BILA|nr:unnamed protein product [Didymodactylos carnosus]CAF4075899.1 unnamed protein product [Didymodactylos carnosus]
MAEAFIKNMEEEAVSRTCHFCVAGLIYKLSDTQLVPVPLVFECINPTTNNIHFYEALECEFTILDRAIISSYSRTIKSILSEPTRTKIMTLNFQTPLGPLSGAYFKQSDIIIRHCVLKPVNSTTDNLITNNTFDLKLNFEQKINSPCITNHCTHSKLYHCNKNNSKCECQINVEQFQHVCVETEIKTNCTLTPERCLKICRNKYSFDPDCICPDGITKTIHYINNNSLPIYRCELLMLSDCDENYYHCPFDYICQNGQCINNNVVIVGEQRQFIPQLALSLLLIALLIGAILTIVCLIICLLKMRLMKSVKFVRSTMTYLPSSSSSTRRTTINSCSTLSTNSSSSPCSTISSSSKSLQLEKCTKIQLIKE